jgi:hypothetical protein
VTSKLLEKHCGREDHAPNRMEDGFEEALRRSLGDFRLNIKKLLFIRNYRFNVVDPSPALPLVDSDGVAVWGNDPVHPLEHGYQLPVDLYIDEICNLQANEGSDLEAASSLQKRRCGRRQGDRSGWKTRAALLLGRTAEEDEEAVEAAEDAAAREDAGSEAEATGEAIRRGVGPPPSTKPAQLVPQTEDIN